MEQLWALGRFGGLPFRAWAFINSTNFQLQQLHCAAQFDKIIRSYKCENTIFYLCISDVIICAINLGYCIIFIWLKLGFALYITKCLDKNYIKITNIHNFNNIFIKSTAYYIFIISKPNYLAISEFYYLPPLLNLNNDQVIQNICK